MMLLSNGMISVLFIGHIGQIFILLRRWKYLEMISKIMQKVNKGQDMKEYKYLKICDGLCGCQGILHLVPVTEEEYLNHYQPERTNPEDDRNVVCDVPNSGNK
jgi:hypothetical protein